MPHSSITQCLYYSHCFHTLMKSHNNYTNTIPMNFLMLYHSVKGFKVRPQLMVSLHRLLYSTVQDRTGFIRSFLCSCSRAGERRLVGYSEAVRFSCTRPPALSGCRLHCIVGKFAGGDCERRGHSGCGCAARVGRDACARAARVGSASGRGRRARRLLAGRPEAAAAETRAAAQYGDAHQYEEELAAGRRVSGCPQREQQLCGRSADVLDVAYSAHDTILGSAAAAAAAATGAARRESRTLLIARCRTQRHHLHDARLDGRLRLSRHAAIARRVNGVGRYCDATNTALCRVVHEALQRGAQQRARSPNDADVAQRIAGERPQRPTRANRRRRRAERSPERPDGLHRVVRNRPSDRRLDSAVRLRIERVGQCTSPQLRSRVHSANRSEPSRGL